MTTEYISRDAAIKVLCGKCQDINQDEDKESCWCIKKDRFNQIPTADVVEVVRCKDCRYFHNGYDEKCCINHKGVVVTDENGFCHHAERRADDG